MLYTLGQRRKWWRSRESNPQELLARQLRVPTHIPMRAIGRNRTCAPSVPRTCATTSTTTACRLPPRDSNPRPTGSKPAALSTELGSKGIWGVLPLPQRGRTTGLGAGTEATEFPWHKITSDDRRRNPRLHAYRRVLPEAPRTLLPASLWQAYLPPLAPSRWASADSGMSLGSRHPPMLCKW